MASSISIIAAALACLLAGGCAQTLDARPSASGSVVAFTAAQAADAREAMMASARGVTDTGPPVSLYPAAGWRWKDLHRAVEQAGALEGIEVAIVHMHQDEARVHAVLRTVEGWPATVDVLRRGDSIVIEAAVGPYPHQAHARARAQRLVVATHQKLMAMGKLPRLAPYGRDRVALP